VAHVLSILNPKHNASVALHGIILSLNPGETPAVVQKAPFRGIETGVGFYYMGSLLSMFAASLAMLGKHLLSRYSLREFDALEERRFELFLRSPTAMIMFAHALNLCGLWCIGTFVYFTTPLAVSIVVIFLATAVFTMLR